MIHLIKHSVSGQYLVGIDEEGFGIFSDNYNQAIWSESEESVSSFIVTNNLTNATASEGGSQPPTKPPF